MDKRFSIISLICFLLLVLVLASGSAAPIRLQFVSWMVAEASGGEEWIPERIKVWEQAHPNVSVEVIPLPWEETPNKIPTQVLAKNAPDIYTIESLWLGKFAKMPGATEDLNKYMPASFTSQLVPAYKGGEIEGKMAGLVWSPNPWVIVFNKDLARRAGVSGSPKDLNDFLQQSAAVHKLGRDIYGAGLQLNLDEYSADTFHIIMWQTGGDLLNSSGQPVVNSPGTVRAVNILKGLRDRKEIPFGEDTRDLRTIFAAEKMGSMFEGPWIAGVLDGLGITRDKWDVSNWPGDVQPASHILCLYPGSKNKDLAWDLMKFIVTDETTTLEYFKKTGLLPMVKTQYDNSIYDTHYAKVFLNQMPRMRNPNVFASLKKAEIEIAFMEVIQAILLGKGEVQASLNALNNRIAEIIAK
jgi:multiple sugar transport system substrate-binding protein